MRTLPFTKLSAQTQLIGAFSLAILTGAVVLCLPPMTHKGISFIDALFTSTSAVCVTGLIVVDTGTYFTQAGQWVILALIQVGGLGIMTFSSAILLALGKSVSMRQDNLLEQAFHHSSARNLYSLLGYVLVFTLAVELIGAVLYFISWSGRYPWPDVLFLSLFHSVSAFCNAGFSLFSDSLMAYKDSPLVNLTTMVLIVLGGIGFLVLYEIYSRFVRVHVRKEEARIILSLHARVVLFTTFILIVGGAVLFFGIEYRHALGGENIGQKALTSLFQSVTARTAGFNTVDIGTLSNAALFLLIILMFIGASPGSCGGGIKTSTVAILFALIRGHMRGDPEAPLLHRTIHKEDAAKAVAVVTAATLVVVAGVLLLIITQIGDTPHDQSRGLFLEYLFEAVSAFGTVGLSMGKTAGLDAVGKIILIGLMFVGRLGPLTAAFFIRRSLTAGAYRYSREHVMVG